MLKERRQGVLKILKFLDHLWATIEDRLYKPLGAFGVASGQFCKGDDHCEGIIHVMLGLPEVIEEFLDGEARDADFGRVHRDFMLEQRFEA
jgi:hypothetical protein